MSSAISRESHPLRTHSIEELPRLSVNMLSYEAAEFISTTISLSHYQKLTMVSHLIKLNYSQYELIHPNSPRMRNKNHIDLT